jgi:ABC-type multidrug transport system fused ATPase/permease subunit
MTLLRRTLALVLVLLGIVGLVGSLAALTALWVYKGPLEKRAISVLDRLEAALGRATKGLRVVRDTTAQAREDLDEFKKTSAPATGDAKKNSLVMRTLARTVKQELAPQVSDVHATLSGVTEASVVLGSLLEGADRLPLGSVGRVDTEELRNLTGLLGEVGKTSRRLSELIPPEKRADDPSAAEALRTDTRAVEEGLNTVHAASADYETRVADLASRVAAIHAGLPNAIQTGSLLLTVVLVWIAISQVIVLLYARLLWRRPSVE